MKVESVLFPHFQLVIVIIKAFFGHPQLFCSLWQTYRLGFAGFIEASPFFYDFDYLQYDALFTPYAFEKRFRLAFLIYL
jgi:hypothetical protein